MLKPTGRPADSSIICTKIATMNAPAEIAGVEVEPIEKNPHDMPLRDIPMMTAVDPDGVFA